MYFFAERLQPFQGSMDMSQASRVKNVATPREIAKVIRGALGSGPDAGLLCDPDLGKVVQNFQEVLVDVLKVTPRPTVTLLKQAAVEAWDVDPGLAHLFATRIAAAASYCRVKKNQSTSGKKLPPPVQRVICIMSKELKARGRQLLRRYSSEAEPPSKRQETPSGAGNTSVTAEAPAPKVPQKAASSSASSSVADVYKLYGLEPRAVSSDVVVLSSQEICSSQEEELRKPKCDTMEYFDHKLLALVRVLPGGTIVQAKMSAGPAGMALATFPGEGPLQTECPNILLQGIKKRPSGKPSSAVAQPPSQAPPPAPSPAVDQPPSQAADVVLAVPLEDAEEAKTDGEGDEGQQERPKKALLMKAKNVYCRAYHKTLKQCLHEGMDKEKAKQEARQAAAQAVKEARDQGALDD